MSKVDPKGNLKTARTPEAVSKGKALENLKPSPDLTGKLGEADPPGASVLHGQQPLPVLQKNWAYHQRMPEIDGHCSPSPHCHHGVTGVFCRGGKKRLSSLQTPAPPGSCVSSVCAQTIVTLNASITVPDALIIPVTSKAIPDTRLMSLVDSGSSDSFIDSGFVEKHHLAAYTIPAICHGSSPNSPRCYKALPQSRQFDLI